MNIENNLPLMTKEEFFEVAKILMPGITWKKYQVMWNDFLLEKARHEKPTEQENIHE